MGSHELTHLDSSTSWASLAAAELIPFVMSIHMASPILSLSNDFELLTMLTSAPQRTSNSYNTKIGAVGAGRYKRREAPLDPLLLAAAISSGPHVTRHHYHHHHAVPAVDDLFPETPTVPATAASTASVMSSALAPVDPPKPKYKSQQAPRSQREKSISVGDKENQREQEPLPLAGLSAGNVPQQQLRRPRGPSLLQNSFVISSANSNGPTVIGAGPPPPSPFIQSFPQHTLSTPYIRNLPPAPLQVQCMARTRIPTPHGPAFLHLYRNNKDEKEHLAFVIDPAQLEQEAGGVEADISKFIRSASLDAKWSEDEKDLDRITRGAYVGRLSPTVHRASKPSQASSSQSSPTLLSPLVRIHSECFTGETIGSMRCDCGEQLDEALRLISSPPSSSFPGRGAVIYLRQEGRGIGLLSKIRAYNLQDMGHDTVQANLLLGHGADERRYDIAAAIMRDLGLERVELLTNNPDKANSLEKEGIRVVKRRAMVPRSWQQQRFDHEHGHLRVDGNEGYGHGNARIGGATLIGGGAAHGPELEKYLRTKIERMGHMLDVPPSYES